MLILDYDNKHRVLESQNNDINHRVLESQNNDIKHTIPETDTYTPTVLPEIESELFSSLTTL